MGIYFSSDIKGGELSIGAPDSKRYDSLSYFNAYEYHEKWEISMSSIEYNTKTVHVYEQRALIAINLPFILIPYSIALLLAHR